MKERFASLLQRQTFWWIQSLGAAIGMVAGSFFLPGGDDLYRYYIPFENGCLDCGYVPYFAQWILWPLRLLPAYPHAWPAWTIVNVAGFMLLAYFTDINPLLFMLSFPFFGQIWLGQIDVFICAGLVVFLFAKNPCWRGLGIALAMTKPQLTFIPLVFIMLLEDPKTFWRLLIVPSSLFLISLMVYGVSWPGAWISNALRDLPLHAWRLASMDIWRFGIFLLPVPLLVKNPRKRLEAGLLVSALATPFFGVYSYVTFLLFDTRWWTVLLSFAWCLGYFWYRATALRLAWILPVAMLIALVYEARSARQQKE